MSAKTCFHRVPGSGHVSIGSVPACPRSQTFVCCGPRRTRDVASITIVAPSSVAPPGGNVSLDGYIPVYGSHSPFFFRSLQHERLQVDLPLRSTTRISQGVSFLPLLTPPTTYLTWTAGTVRSSLKLFSWTYSQAFMARCVLQATFLACLRIVTLP